MLAADVVDKQLEAYLQRNGIPQTFGAQERILVCITPRANAAAMIESGNRNAERFHGDLTVAYVSQAEISAGDQDALERNLAIARAAPTLISRFWTERIRSRRCWSSRMNTASRRFSSATRRASNGGNDSPARRSTG